MNQTKFNNFRILLGSQSPRRTELLTKSGIDHRIVSFDCEEIYDDNLNRYDVPVFLSKLKSNFYASISHGELLITADTVVILNDQILGKPSSPEEAMIFLNKLSENTHHVVTGVTLRSIEKTMSFSETTEVIFGKLSSEMIKYYVDRFSPLDKAGAYGIQEYIGHVGIKSINGSYNNVMGLPTHRVVEELEQF